MDPQASIGHHCEACNASFKSIQALKRHEQTMKHQDKVDPEGAEPKKKARVVDPQASIGHHCEACNASFKSIQALKRHEQTMKHQDKVDPEGAEPKKKARDRNEVKLTRTRSNVRCQ